MQSAFAEFGAESSNLDVPVISGRFAEQDLVGLVLLATPAVQSTCNEDQETRTSPPVHTPQRHHSLRVGKPVQRKSHARNSIEFEFDHPGSAFETRTIPSAATVLSTTMTSGAGCAMMQHRIFDSPTCEVPLAVTGWPRHLLGHEFVRIYVFCQTPFNRHRVTCSTCFCVPSALHSKPGVDKIMDSTRFEREGCLWTRFTRLATT